MIKRFLANLFYKVINSAAYIRLNNTALVMAKDKVFQELIVEFKSFGNNSYLPDVRIIKNPQYISIGKNFSSMYNLRIEAWDNYRGQKFHPEISIGDNVNMNTDVHIGCINKVTIGDNVLIASRVYISDHSHGRIVESEILTPPAKRHLFSKGPVFIQDNVWIGEGVCIMPGVTIGENSIIGANSVVTKDIPSNSIAVGIPAKIIKSMSLI